MFDFHPAWDDVFGETFRAAYPGGTLWCFPLQLVGLNFYVPYGGFNPTWWFMNAIVPLYLLYPFFKKISTSSGVLLLMIAATLAVGKPTVVCRCLVPFSVGIVVGQLNMIEEIARRNHCFVFMACAAISAVAFIYRTDHVNGGAFGAFAVMSFFIVYLHSWKWFQKPLIFLGRHSMNIFLIHTFFRGRWFSAFFSSAQPVATFVLLLAASLVSSILIEEGKKVCAWGYVHWTSCRESET